MGDIIMLDQSALMDAVDQLCQRDPVLQAVVDEHGYPPLWSRPPGFATLIHIILEQQVSLASARACFDKLNAKLPSLTPDDFLTLEDDELLTIGFSRQKARYSRHLARAVLNQSLELKSFQRLPDSAVFDQLTAQVGIGPWTANIYLLMALGRPDIWPGGDLALEVALQRLHDLDHRPKGAKFDEYGEPWRPYRAVAARILWHYYLA